MNGTELNMEKPEITLNGLADLTEGSFLLIDTRDEASYEYGTMENAVHFPNLYEEARAGRLPKDQKLVLFCMHGLESIALAARLREMGYDAVSLKDGYGAWLRAFSLKKEDRSREIELSIMAVSLVQRLMRCPTSWRPKNFIDWDSRRSYSRLRMSAITRTLTQRIL